MFQRKNKPVQTPEKLPGMRGRAKRKFLWALGFPLLLGAVYIVQLLCPGFFKQYALWSAHPHWWQFFTNGFLSGNWIHLLFNICGISVVCSQFASQIRQVFLFVYFVLFSAAASFLYFRFFMPSHAWLVGASGGVYALIGILCWFQRRDQICFFGWRRLSMPFLPAMLVLLGLEFLIATFWIRVLAWQLHMMAFSISIFTAIAAHAAYAFAHWLADQNARFEQGALVLRKIKQVAVTIPVTADR
jgi:membrane associated rhomboid family serine protease